jgi:diguanylate cyclase (GGDEF)-like protein
MVIKKAMRKTAIPDSRKHWRNPHAALKRATEAHENFFSAFESTINARGRAEYKNALRNALAASFESVMARHRLHQLAAMDPKFPIENDAAFNERVFRFLREKSARQRNFSFAIVDLDFLRRLNKKKGGYAKGDAGLLAVTNAVVRIARKHNGFVGKFGGDEFKVLIPKPSQVLMKELQKALAEVRTKGFSFSGGVADARTAKIGVNSIQELRERIDRLANIALKVSKNTGKSRITVFRKKP